jgi:hypothetical protein
VEVWGDLFACLEYGQRWDEAAKMLADAHSRPAEITPRRVEALKAFLLAARSHAPADLREARDLALTTAREGNLDLSISIQSLSQLGLIDDAFALATRTDPKMTVADPGSSLMFVQPPGAAPDNFGTTALFIPLTAPLRRDPRFMKLAARLGLVDYWRTSAHWPDFCSDPTLPYNCKAVAAQLPSVPPAKS